MKRRQHSMHVPAIALASLVAAAPGLAQSPDSPLTRMRPIGSPSAVDQYRAPTVTSRYRSSASSMTSPVRQAVVVDDLGNERTIQQTQGFTAPPIPDEFGMPVAPPTTDSPFDGAGPAPAITLPSEQPSIAPPATPLPSTGLPSDTYLPSAPPTDPRSLPFNNGNLSQVPLDATSSGGDLAPIPQPQLNDGFATIDNCPCVSPPSGYVAATGWPQRCAPVAYQVPATVQAPPPYVAPPATTTTVVEETIVLPPTMPARRSGVPRGPLISFGQDKNPVQIGQGIVGQPVAYVPGQRFRNWLRYIFP